MFVWRRRGRKSRHSIRPSPTPCLSLTPARLSLSLSLSCPPRVTPSRETHDSKGGNAGERQTLASTRGVHSNPRDAIVESLVRRSGRKRRQRRPEFTLHSGGNTDTETDALRMQMR